MTYLIERLNTSWNMKQIELSLKEIDQIDCSFS